MTVNLYGLLDSVYVFCVSSFPVGAVRAPDLPSCQQIEFPGPIESPIGDQHVYSVQIAADGVQVYQLPRADDMLE